MHTYRKSAASDATPEAWTVGIWSGSGWMSVRDFASEEDAAAFCNYLAGGDGKPFKPAETEEAHPEPIEEAPELDELAAASDHFADDDAEDHEDKEPEGKPRSSGHRRRRK